MNYIRYAFPPLLFLAIFLLLITGNHEQVRLEGREEGEAAQAFQWWYAQRSLPYDAIPAGAYSNAFKQYKATVQKHALQKTASTLQPWHSLGPNNVGGRVLSLAIDPVNSDIIWAGSASGGLWKSTTAGVGETAWTYVNTGFPTISISAIAIDTTDHNNIYIGTGEISYYQRALIGIRGARSSYGMGIFRSTDGGVTWDTTSLVWQVSQITAVERIVINPKNHNTLYAATSEGTYKSVDRGVHWSQVFSEHVAMDIVIDPSDTTKLYVSCGTFNSSPNPGLYKTTNSGSTWTKLAGGLPTTNFGRTALAISPTDPNLLYAGIGDASSGGIIGLYRTTDYGATWSQRSSTNYASTQSWYNNCVAVSPDDPNVVYCSGLDIYKATNGGGTLNEKSLWYNGYFVIPPGSDEGPPNYSHADNHAIAIDPKNSLNMFFGNDGGVFASTDGGETFGGRNGGFVTTQFYPGFASSSQDSFPAIGGLQDNGVLRYNGNTQWDKVDGGDGGWCAIDPTNDQIMFDEYVNLAISKSTTGGNGFSSASSGIPGGVANFIAPFVIAPSSTNILYAGANNVYKTTDGGGNWVPSNGTSTLNGTNIACIGVSYSSADTVMTGTGSGAPGETPLFQIFSSINGGQTWTNVTGSLPNRYPTDISFDTHSSSLVYISYSGYNTSHIFKTTDLGASWIDISSDLPNIPAQSVLPDPNDSLTIYAGTDLGIFRTTNGGGSWEDFNDGMPFAMIHDITFCAANYSLRAATQGNGVYERYLPKQPKLTLGAPIGGETWRIGDADTIRWSQKFVTTVSIKLSTDSGTTWTSVIDSVPASQGVYRWIVSGSPSNHALIRVQDLHDNSINSTGGYFAIVQMTDVARGWNIVSLPLTPSDPRKTVLFPTATTQAYTYHSSYTASESLKTGEGFWLKFSSPQNFNFAGDTLHSDTIQLNQGWNMIGAISYPLPITSITVDPPSNTISKYYGYKNGYFSADTLFPKHGYWIKAAAAGTLVLTGSASLPKTTNPVSTELSQLNSLTFTDSRGNTGKLFFGNPAQNIKLSRYELPPIPPDGAFDVRYTSQQMLALTDGKLENFPIQIRGAVGAISIDWDIQSEPGSFSLLSDGREITTLNGKGMTILAENKIINIALHAAKGLTAEIPNRFALHQNYPNPFNPTTNISFDLKEDSRVVLTVYTLTGQKIRTLVNEQRTAGSYSVSFDASSLASGIYFYKLEAGAFSDLKKLVLIR